MNVLLLYGTTEGQTKKITQFVADRLVQKGHRVSIANAAEGGLGHDPRGFAAVLIAASLHAGRYQAAVVRFVRENRTAISARPNAFLSVSLAAASDDSGDLTGLKQCVDKFIAETGWTPGSIHHVAGAFRFTAYGFFKRWAMRYIAYRKGAPTDTSCDYELTDWDDLAGFADCVTEGARPARYGVDRHLRES